MNYAILPYHLIQITLNLTNINNRQSNMVITPVKRGVELILYPIWELTFTRAMRLLGANECYHFIAFMWARKQDTDVLIPCVRFLVCHLFHNWLVGCWDWDDLTGTAVLHPCTSIHCSKQAFLIISTVTHDIPSVLPGSKCIIFSPSLLIGIK